MFKQIESQKMFEKIESQILETYYAEEPRADYKQEKSTLFSFLTAKIKQGKEGRAFYKASRGNPAYRFFNLIYYKYMSVHEHIQQERFKEANDQISELKSRLMEYDATNTLVMLELLACSSALARITNVYKLMTTEEKDKTFSQPTDR